MSNLNRQLNLFSARISFLGNSFTRKTKLVIPKATLSLRKKIKEKQGHRITRQYMNIPLFFGLPTMERWLEWEKKHAKKD